MDYYFFALKTKCSKQNIICFRFLQWDWDSFLWGGGMVQEDRAVAKPTARGQRLPGNIRR